MRATIIALTLSVALAGPVFAQTAPTAMAPGTIGAEDPAKVKQVFVYGEDPCPAGNGDEIVVCARMPDNERFRIPKDLRTDPNDPKVQSWVNRARTLETVGATGTNSCSTSGSDGFTGCFQRLAAAAREERKTMMGSATWADAIQKAREERLSNLDAESDVIEQQAKEEEAEAAKRKAAQDAANKQGPIDQPR